MEIVKVFGFLVVVHDFYGFFVKFCWSNTEGGRGAAKAAMPLSPFTPIPSA